MRWWRGVAGIITCAHLVVTAAEDGGFISGPEGKERRSLHVAWIGPIGAFGGAPDAASGVELVGGIIAVLPRWCHRATRCRNAENAPNAAAPRRGLTDSDSLSAFSRFAPCHRDRGSAVLRGIRSIRRGLGGCAACAGAPRRPAPPGPGAAQTPASNQVQRQQSCWAQALMKAADVGSTGPPAPINTYA